jgi:hypothetical protein
MSVRLLEFWNWSPKDQSQTICSHYILEEKGVSVCALQVVVSCRLGRQQEITSLGNMC